MKKYLILLLFVALISGCAGKKNTTNPIAQNLNLAEPLKEKTVSQASSEEIANPNLILPADVNAGQIQNFFQNGDLYYALVRRQSMNILTDTPSDFQPKFVGVLKAKQGDKAWTKYIEIKDLVATDKNNPYFLWTSKEQLRLTVVDQNGAGSGEGLLKLFKIENNQSSLIGCYYYPATGSAKEYFSDTKNFSKFTAQPMESCNNVELSVIK
jgi:hypothetical protein